jgi:TPR repeat protein
MQEPPWKLPSLEPDWLPPPPAPIESALGALGRLVGVIVIAAAMGAVGSLWGVAHFLGSAPRPQNPLSPHQANVAANLSADPAEAPPATSGLAPGLADDDARRAADVAADPVRRRAPVPDVQSASAPSLPAPPAAPSRSTVLQSNRQSSPDPASAPATPLNAANIAVMLKSGAEFMANGNVAAARMMLQPAADAGDATAAFALAETYDPMVLARLGVKGGIAPDVALAQRWYAKANALGTSAAQERLVRLTHRSE